MLRVKFSVRLTVVLGFNKSHLGNNSLSTYLSGVYGRGLAANAF